MFRSPLAAVAMILALDASVAEPSGRSCEAAILAAVESSNPSDVCKRLNFRGGPEARSNFEDRFAVETRDLGDGSKGYAIREQAEGDALTRREDLLYVLDDGALRLVYDGRGILSSYSTARPKVNGRYQIERVVEAKTSFYEKRETEIWFWDGKRYERAFTESTSRLPDGGKRSDSLEWNGDAKEEYVSAGKSIDYKVVSGDTLSGIARKLGISMAELTRQNPSANARSLRLGQVIRYESWRVGAR